MSPPGSKPPTILIADDDRELVQVLALRCRALGVHVECAHDALRALNLMQPTMPDLICLDVNMPAGNGLSVCEMLASEPRWAKTPVIILTGRTDPEIIIRCHQLCAYYVLKGGDVWSRIEPLVGELLSVGDRGAPLAAAGRRN
jgi:CheY-like chemotaxis protein